MRRSKVLVRKLPALSLSLASILLLNSLAATAATDWSEHEKTASQLREGKDYDAAVDEYFLAYNSLMQNKIAVDSSSIRLLREYIRALSDAKLVDQSVAVQKGMLGLSSSETATNVVEANNEGVKALSQNKFALAVEKFELALKADPLYERARKNLAIAYNNIGLEKRKQPAEALRMFRHSLFLDPTNRTTRDNLNGMLTLAGKDPKNAQERIKIADALLASEDKESAVVEYTEILRFYPSDELRAKLDAIVVDDPALSEFKGKIPDKGQATESQDDGFGPYMAKLQSAIKNAWNPQKGSKTAKAAVRFTVSNDGRIANSRIVKSSNLPAFDQAALDALKKIAKLDPLPKGSPQSVDIEFTFDYNVYKANAPEARKPTDSDAEELMDTKLHQSLKGTIALLIPYALHHYRVAKIDSLISRAKSETDKSKALTLVAQAMKLDGTDRLAPDFDAAVKGLGKNSESAADLIAIAEERQKEKDYTTAVAVLDRATRVSTSEADKVKIKQLLRSDNAYATAKQLSERSELRRSSSSPYDLYCRYDKMQGNLLREKIALRDEPDLPPFPLSVDFLTSDTVRSTNTASTTAGDTAGGAKPAQSTSDGSKGLNPAAAKPGTKPAAAAPAKPATPALPAVSVDPNGVVPANLNAEDLLEKFSNAIKFDSNNLTARSKQSNFLVQYGNTLMAQNQLPRAISRYREALYMDSSNSLAGTKLDAALKQYGLDPSQPYDRMLSFAQLYYQGRMEASIAELRALTKLVDDGPSRALLGMCMLDESCRSEEAYKNLSESFNKTWPADAKKELSAAHMVVAAMLRRDAVAQSKERKTSDAQKALQSMSLECRRALAYNPKNQDAIDALIGVSLEAITFKNNANNNLLLGCAYMIKGEKDKAARFIETARSKDPANPLVEKALASLKTSTKSD